MGWNENVCFDVKFKQLLSLPIQRIIKKLIKVNYTINKLIIWKKRY